MGYTIRDPVSDGTLPTPGERRSRGFAEKMEINREEAEGGQFKNYPCFEPSFFDHIS